MAAKKDKKTAKGVLSDKQKEKINENIDFVDNNDFNNNHLSNNDEFISNNSFRNNDDFNNNFNNEFRKEDFNLESKNDNESESTINKINTILNLLFQNLIFLI